MKAKNIACASLCLKINIVTLIGQKKSEKDKQEEADIFIDIIKKRINSYGKKALSPTKSPKKKVEASSTVVPFFDIDFKAIFDNLSDKKLNREIGLHDIQKHMPLLKDMFGSHVDVTDLRNQSVVSMGNI